MSNFLSAINVNPLPDALGGAAVPVVPSPGETHQTNLPAVPAVNQDFEMARENLLTIVKTGMDSITKLSQIADQSQHPRAFEVLSNLMKTMMDAQKDLLDLRKKNQELNVSEGSGQPAPSAPKEVHNHLYVGSTKDLQSVFEQMKNNGGNAS